MAVGKLFVLALGVVALLAPAAGAEVEQYTHEFAPTQNAPPGAQGTMALQVSNGETTVHFRLRGGHPNTVYTIWTVFNILKEPLPTSGTSVPSSSASGRPGFPPEGNGVSPLARLDDAFTSGMGLDPGASFVTDDQGDGEIQVKLDYDLVREAPVSNKDLIAQCVPGPLASDGKCYAPSKLLRVTTTWLRVFIGEIPAEDRGAMCANYDARYDKESPLYDPVLSKGTNALLWQCIDPATVAKTGAGLPRVQRYVFDHFRLANHPDDLTHGFIGGNAEDHWIDMVGRRADLLQTQGTMSSAATRDPSVR